MLAAGLAAGWVDAVVGGGGLIQLPVLLLVPGIAPVQALATNKLGSIFGTTTSAVTYYRRASPDLKTAVPMAAIALAGSFAGAIAATLLPSAVFKPVIVAALVAVALFTALQAHRRRADPAAPPGPPALCPGRPDRRCDRVLRRADRPGHRARS